MGVDGTVGRHPDRSPVWPQGTVGSISHCRHLAVAAAASDAALLSLGVDVEEAADLAAELRTVLFTAKELAMVTGTDDDLLAGILFSLKESAFKCWYPTSRIFLDYTDVEVSPDPTSGYFIADAVGPRRSSHPVPLVQGRFMIHFGHIFSAAWIEHPCLSRQGVAASAATPGQGFRRSTRSPALPCPSSGRRPTRAPTRRAS